MRLGGSACLRPSSGLTAATIAFHPRFAAQRFVTPGCCLSIHLLNDCPSSSLGRGAFSTTALFTETNRSVRAYSLAGPVRYTGTGTSGMTWLQHSEPGRKESQQFQNVVRDIFGLEASELASLGAKRFHGKPPLIGLSPSTQRRGKSANLCYHSISFRPGSQSAIAPTGFIGPTLSALLKPDCYPHFSFIG
jgi:hypothetical protein